MKKFLLFQVALLVTFLFIKPDMANAETDSFSEQTASVWMEEGELIWERLDEKGIEAVSTLTTESSDYAAYQFEKEFKCRYKKTENDEPIILFKLKISGTVYFYENGKVHLYSMSSQVIETASKYSVTIIDNDIINTDGLISIGNTYFYTTSTKYPQGSYRAYVYFQYGSVLTYSGLEEN